MWDILLTVLLVLFLICGFAITPIAGAEFDTDHEYYDKLVVKAALDSADQIKSDGYSTEVLDILWDSNSDRALKTIIAFCEEKQVKFEFFVDHTNILHRPEWYPPECIGFILLEDQKTLACTTLRNALKTYPPKAHF